MKKIIRLTESDLTRIVRRVIKESCEDGNCVPGFSEKPTGRWKDEERDARDGYLEYQRRGGYLDPELFNELYDEMSGKAYFSFETQGRWSSEDGEGQNKNQTNIIESFPTVDIISSWEEWVDSKWFNTTYLAFSKTATKKPISIKMGGGDAKWGEEPIQKKKAYFNQYLNNFGPLLVKKR